MKRERGSREGGSKEEGSKEERREGGGDATRQW